MVKVDLDQVCEDVCRVYYTNSERITLNIYRRDGKFKISHALLRMDKTWNQLLSSLGLKCSSYTNIDDQDYLDDLINVANKLSKLKPSMIEYNQYGLFSSDAIADRFGTWNEAIRLAGLVATKQDVINDIKRLAVDYDTTPSSSYYIKHGNYPLSTVCRLFDTWNQALQASELSLFNRHIYSKTFLLDELHRFQKTYNRTPSKYDLGGDYPSDKTYSVYFGSFLNALRAAGLQPLRHRYGRDGIMYDSAEEAAVADTLYSNFINYESHKKVCDNRLWACDFYLSDQDLWVEYDGLSEYRKILGDGKGDSRYLEKLAYYDANAYYYIILYKKDNILQRINCELIFDKKTFVINEIHHRQAVDFLARTHYIGTAPSSKYRFGVFYESLLVGVALFGNNANPTESMLCLSRFATLDRVKGCLGSFFISRCLKKIKQTGYTGGIVAFSDPRFHNGTLYKAANFKFKSSGRKKMDYIYIDQNGKEYHKSKCRVRAGQSEAIKAQELGLMKVEVLSKERWEYHI